MFLDEQCIFKGKTDGARFAMARASSNFMRMYCLLEEEIDPSSMGKVCIDGCGNAVQCYGTIRPEIQQRFIASKEFVKERELIFDIKQIERDYCGE